jgi:hypothetical protein
MEDFTVPSIVHAGWTIRHPAGRLSGTCRWIRLRHFPIVFPFLLSEDSTLSIPSSLSRRNLFKAAALGAGALAAPQLLVRAAQAEVPMAAAQPAAFKRFSLGDFEVTVLSDGHRLVPGPQNIFGTNTTEEEVSELLKTNYLPVDKMQFTFAPTLVNTGADLVLFDAGNGEGGREGGVGQTLANLKASGYAPEQVTVVVLTHLHGDHIGGLM